MQKAVVREIQEEKGSSTYPYGITINDHLIGKLSKSAVTPTASIFNYNEDRNHTGNNATPATLLSE